MPKHRFQTFLAITILSLLALSPHHAAAVPMLDFVGGQPVGQIGYDGGSAPLESTLSFAITAIRGLGTPVSAADLAVTGGSLQFSTGALTSFTSDASSSNWIFGSGGTITVTGGIPALGIADGTTLMIGSFDSASVSGNGSTSPINALLSASFTDVKLDDVLTYFGLSADAQFSGELNISAVLVDHPTNPFPAFLSTAATGPILGPPFLRNSVTAVSVPAPPPVLLLAWGLPMVLCRCARRRPRLG